MKNMEIKDLTAADICSIIKAGARANVSKLTIGGLEIDFGTQQKVEEGIQLPLPGMVTTSPQSGTIEQQTSPNKIELSEEDEQNLRFANEAQMTLEDPQLFEEYVTDELLYGEVVNEGNERRRLEQSV